jgi:hypothetical protein
MGLKRDELGFIRPTGYGRIPRQELESLLGLTANEAVYRTGVDQARETFFAL